MGGEQFSNRQTNNRPLGRAKKQRKAAVKGAPEGGEGGACFATKKGNGGQAPLPEGGGGSNSSRISLAGFFYAIGNNLGEKKAMVV